MYIDLVRRLLSAVDKRGVTSNYLNQLKTAKQKLRNRAARKRQVNKEPKGTSALLEEKQTSSARAVNPSNGSGNSQSGGLLFECCQRETK